MKPECEKKLDKLRDILKETGGCAVAYSGGVDSSLLLTVAHEVLGDRALGVIATSSTYPEREFKRAIDLAKGKNFTYVVINSEELDIDGFSKNPADRCYYCKKELFDKVREQAQARELNWIADGTNADDTGDYRPGMIAARELGVLSPLLEAGLTKDDIRTILREVYELDIADKPSMACLASRFPYGMTITKNKLAQVEKIETYLEALGFRVYRARHHGDIVRLELGAEELKAAMDVDTRSKIVAVAKEHGFKYVTLDMEGYRTGSMNEVL
ncbi:MAG: ATP-dependent sacrificial sulfur transferase LarE, partial [Candidatus Latescibacteria bacterium]|nr:ATP-dependent sacrificial sulfur transferase LarE [Candidatus Latescibacterota bacterium]